MSRAAVLLLACLAAGCSEAADTSRIEIDTVILASYRPLPVMIKRKDERITSAHTDLGRMLFHEKRLSRGHTVSCDSCHDLENYGMDSRRVSTGHDGQQGRRNALSVYNAAGHIAQFWDGRAADVEEQARIPILDPLEMAMPDEAYVVKTLESIPGYVEAFRKAFPDDDDPVTFDNVVKAIGAFERGLVTPSRWDLFLQGDENALTRPEKAGFQKFVETKCVVCHLGTYVGGQIFNRLGLMKPWPGNRDPGRYNVTKNEADRFFFKVPSLRNVEKTAPYLHDGSIHELEKVVAMMAEHQLGVEIPAADVRSIVTFLKALTGKIPTGYIKRPELPASGPNTPKPDAR